MPEYHNSKILRKLREFDAQPYTIQLNYRNKQYFKTATGGLISLIFYIASAVVIVLNVYLMIAENQLIFDQIQVKNNLSNITIDQQRFGLLLTGSSQGKSFNLTIQDLVKYGLKVQTEQNLNDQKKNYSDVIQGNNTQFYNFSQYLFMNPLCNFHLNGSSKIISNNSYHRLGIIIRNISSQLNFVQSLNELKVKFVFINNVISPKQYHPVIGTKVRQFFIRNELPITSHQTQFLDIFFKKVEFSTDLDKFFQSKKIDSDYAIYDEQNENYVLTNDDFKDDRLVVIKLKRSLYTVQYNRYYKKIATYLAETFGVIGLISLVFLIYKGYNRWSFTQNELSQPNQQQRTNIFKYYLNLLHNLKRMTKQSLIYQQFEHNLDIHKILSRLDDFEARLRLLQGNQNLNEQYFQHKQLRKKSNKKDQLLDE